MYKMARACWTIDRLDIILSVWCMVEGRGKGRGSSIPMLISVSLSATCSDDAHTIL